MIDVEVRKIIDNQYQECKVLIEQNKEKLAALAERLLEKETIGLPDIVEILGPRPFPHKQNLLDYLEELKERAIEDEAEIEKAATESEDEGDNEDKDKEAKEEEPKATEKSS